MARALPSAPQVGIIMGSQSDWETMVNAADTLKQLGVAFRAEESRVGKEDGSRGVADDAQKTRTNRRRYVTVVAL